MTLKQRLIEQIRAGGSVPFEELMAAALYDPEGGFFTSKSLRSVKSGDFLTSPEVSPLFGETLAKFVDQELSTLPLPPPAGGRGRRNDSRCPRWGRWPGPRGRVGGGKSPEGITQDSLSRWRERVGERVEGPRRTPAPR